MTRSELIERVAAQFPTLYIREVEKAVDVFFKQIEQTLQEGKRVELRGFGSFGAKERATRKARNPRNGAQVIVEPKRAPYFRMGKKLFNELNDN